MPLITRAGVDLHYVDLGSGPAVFFHTGGGGDGTMWQSAGYVDALPGRRCLLFDHRGHGRSGRPTLSSAHTLDEYVADALAVLDAAGVERAAMIGYSDGARVIFRLAARHPDRVTAIVAIGGVDRPGDDLAAARRSLVEEVRTVGGMRGFAEHVADFESEPAPGWLIENLASTPTEMFVLELEGWADAEDECTDFPQIRVPTLIVCGELETEDGSAEQAVQALADGALVKLPGFGHLQAFYRTDVSMPPIADFLARNAPLDR